MTNEIKEKLLKDILDKNIRKNISIREKNMLREAIEETLIQCGKAVEEFKNKLLKRAFYVYEDEQTILCVESIKVEEYFKELEEVEFK